jgi:hypothetical protein
MCKACARKQRKKPVPTDHLTLTVIALYRSETPGAISIPVSELHLRPQYGRRGIHGIVVEDVTIRLADTFTVVLPTSPVR